MEGKTLLCNVKFFFFDSTLHDLKCTKLFTVEKCFSTAYLANCKDDLTLPNGLTAAS